jgi:hypothetical protein
MAGMRAIGEESDLSVTQAEVIIADNTPTT